jgi:Flp pilus assembly protein TadD
MTATSPASVPVSLEAALAVHRRGDVDAAAVAYETFLAHQPGHGDALALLGAARRAQGRAEEAERLIRAALAVMPVHAGTWQNLGNALVDLGRLEDAADAYRTAAALAPGDAEPWFSLGCVLTRLDRRTEAEDSYRRAIAACSEHEPARHNLANLLIDRGLAHEGIALLRAVLEAQPHLAEAHFNLALALLRQGDYATGFAKYEWRWRAEGFPSPRRHTSLREWDGRAFAGRRLLVYAEQGLGDTIQFARFLPLVASLGGDVIFEVPRTLLRLLKGTAGADRVVPHRPVADPGSVDADIAVSLMSLPHRLGLTLGSIPRPAAYVAAETELVHRWAERLGDGGRPAVGLCWHGNPASPVDRGRSLPDVRLLAPLAAVPDVRLVALQMLPAEALEPHDGSTGWRLKGLPFVVEHPGPGLDNGADAFVDTAAIIAGLDLVITTDTAIAHLACALGRPTWVMLRDVADWRWLTERTDSPWYPTMRLFRQTEPGDWPGVIGAVRNALAERRMAGVATERFSSVSVGAG